MTPHTSHHRVPHKLTWVLLYSPLALCTKVRSKRAKKSCHKETALVWRARAFMLKPVKEKERVRFMFSSLYPIHHHHYHQSFIMIKSKYTMPLATHGAFQTGGCGTQESADHFWRSEKKVLLELFYRSLWCDDDDNDG